MKQLLPLLLFACCFTLFGQSKPFEISGSLRSEDANEPLESATIYLERVKDTTLLTYTISDRKGLFNLSGKTPDDELDLFISYVGYQSIKRRLSMDQPTIDLGEIKMVPGETLDEVVIRSVAPITIKKDTLEFNVKSFKTRKDATVEDLLKELPGVEVNEEGEIIVNGKPVNKILVNGKPFFGDDPTITTRNLTKEIIEKVQITDTKTDAEAFAGEEGDDQNKTINLTIKEENNKGVFGRVAGGAGTDERYEFAGIFNYFDNDQRVSVLAGGNNINSPGFSFGEITKMFGRGTTASFNSNGSFSINGRSFGLGDGIVTSRNAGTTYADSFGEKVEISADYFYAGSNSENEQTTQRENIIPGNRFFTNSSAESVNDNNDHRMNMRLDIKPDSMFLINIRPRFQFNNGMSRSSRFEQSRDSDQVLTNESSVSSMRESRTNRFSNDLDITKRFGSDGSYLKFNLSTEVNDDTSDEFLNSTASVFGDDPSEIIRDQFTDRALDFTSYYARADYRLPLVSKKLFMNFKYSHRDDRRNSRQSTFDFNEDSGQYDLFNTELSTDFEFRNERYTPALRMNYRGEYTSASLEFGYVFRTLTNSDELRPELSLSRRFEAPELSSNFNHRFSDKASVYAGYNLSNTPPTLEQLQPFQDVSDPLNITTGNPDLKPTNNHSLYTGFNNFDFQKGTGFYGYLSFNAQTDQVVSQTLVDENFIRNTTFVNVNGNYNGNISGTFSKDIKLDSIRTLKIRVGSSASLSNFVNFNNDVLYDTRNTTLSPNVNLTFVWKDVFQLRPNYRINITRSRFDIDAFEDQNFVRHTLRLRTTTYVPKGLEWQNDISYNYNPNVAEGFQRSVWFWNSTLAYSVLKDQGTVTLKVYDLLNQNNNAQRTVNANFIQDSQSTVLRRYFMLSFSWKFNSLGSKGKTDDGGIFFFD